MIRAKEPVEACCLRGLGEERLVVVHEADLRGDELRKMNQNGMLALIYAHLFSLSQIRE